MLIALVNFRDSPSLGLAGRGRSNLFEGIAVLTFDFDQNGAARTVIFSFKLRLKFGSYSRGGSQSQRLVYSEGISVAAFVFKCPLTGEQVQGWSADDGKDDQYRAVTCLACHHLHQISPQTGKVKRRSGTLQDFADFSELLH